MPIEFVEHMFSPMVAFTTARVPMRLGRRIFVRPLDRSAELHLQWLVPNTKVKHWL